MISNYHHQYFYDSPHTHQIQSKFRPSSSRAPATGVEANAQRAPRDPTGAHGTPKGILRVTSRIQTDPRRTSLGYPKMLQNHAPVAKSKFVVAQATRSRLGPRKHPKDPPGHPQNMLQSHAPVDEIKVRGCPRCKNRLRKPCVGRHNWAPPNFLGAHNASEPCACRQTQGLE